jgi:hypothetical protein
VSKERNLAQCSPTQTFALPVRRNRILIHTVKVWEWIMDNKN